MLEWLRSRADVLLYGAGTARADRRQIRFTFPERAAEYNRRRSGTLPPMVIVGTRPAFDWSSPFWSTPTPITLVLPAAASRGSVPAAVEVTRVPDTADLVTVVDRLRRAHLNPQFVEDVARAVTASLKLDPDAAGAGLDGVHLDVSAESYESIHGHDIIAQISVAAA